MAELLTISALAARTGVPRTSIHFYLREGLLPTPQKTAANHSLYTEDHVRLLDRIRELKATGLALADVRGVIGDELAEIEQRDVDLIDREHDRIRKRILRVATEEFMSRGYEQTRVADIVRKAKVNSQVFYSFFPSKGELLAESFRTFITWNLAFVEPQLRGADPGERLLGRMVADARATEFGSSVLSLIRAEVPNGRAADLTRLVEQAWAPVIGHVVAELEQALQARVAPPVPLELLAHSLIGAHHNSSLRATWDDKYDREEVLATHVWLFLTVLDALGRQTEPDPYMTRYRDLIKEVAGCKPESPPAVEE